MNNRKHKERFRLKAWQAYLSSLAPLKRERVAKRENVVRRQLENPEETTVDLARLHHVTPDTLRAWVKEFKSYVARRT